MKTLFDIDVENSNVRKVIDSYMSRAWRGHRATLHAYFKKIGGEADPTKAKITPPSDVKKEDWEYLCDMWSDEKYLVMFYKYMNYNIVNHYGIQSNIFLIGLVVCR